VAARARKSSSLLGNNIRKKKALDMNGRR